MKQKALFHPRIFNDQEWAEGYYKRNKKSISRFGKRLAGILKQSGFTKGKILDVGCGFASVPIEIAKSFPEATIVGIDLAEPLLEIGRTQINHEGLQKQITLCVGDAQNLSYQNNSFDVLINTFLLHIVEHPVMMLNEIERVAKPEATIIISDLRRGFLAYAVSKFRTAYTLTEAQGKIMESNIRQGTMGSGLFWWDYIHTNSLDTAK